MKLFLIRVAAAVSRRFPEIPRDQKREEKITESWFLAPPSQALCWYIWFLCFILRQMFAQIAIQFQQPSTFDCIAGLKIGVNNTIKSSRTRSTHTLIGSNLTVMTSFRQRDYCNRNSNPYSNCNKSSKIYLLCSLLWQTISICSYKKANVRFVCVAYLCPFLFCFYQQKIHNHIFSYEFVIVMRKQIVERSGPDNWIGRHGNACIWSESAIKSNTSK